MNDTEARGPEDALWRVLETAFATAGRVAVVGDAPSLPSSRFAPADGDAAGGDAVLVVGGEDEALARGCALARAAGRLEVHVLLDGPARPDALERIHRAGLAVAGLERVLWRAPGTATGGSRLERLDAETRSTLARCVRTDDPGSVAVLEEAVLELCRRLDVAAQLQLEHARTRDVERERALRLERLEKLVDTNWVEEAERLRSELDALTSTRLVRLGERYWRLRDRLLGRSR